MTLSRDTFGHDEEIGWLFEQYDRLVRWEEHDSRLDATDPVVERAVMRGRIVAFIANTATLQQDAHTSIAEPEPQDVGEAWRRGAAGGVFATWFTDDPSWPYQVAYRVPVGVEQAIRADERKRWAEREQQLVEALRQILTLLSGVGRHAHMGRILRDVKDAEATARAVLNQERPA